jgi:hypothetical protein
MKPDQIRQILNALEEHSNTPNRTCVVAKQLGLPKSTIQHVISEWCIDTARRQEGTIHVKH